MDPSDPRGLRRLCVLVAAFVFGGMALAAALVAPSVAPGAGMSTLQAFGVGFGGLLLVAWPLTLLGLGAVVVGVLAHIATRWS
jgi:hypothetical protein